MTIYSTHDFTQSSRICITFFNSIIDILNKYSEILSYLKKLSPQSKSSSCPLGIASKNRPSVRKHFMQKNNCTFRIYPTPMFSIHISSQIDKLKKGDKIKCYLPKKQQLLFLSWLGKRISFETETASSCVFSFSSNIQFRLRNVLRKLYTYNINTTSLQIRQLLTP